MIPSRFILITRRPRASTIRDAYASARLASFIMGEQGESYEEYEREERKLKEAAFRIKSVAAELGPVLEIERNLLPSTPLGRHDVLIAIGQDGLVANTLRYSADIPILGVNPDPDSYEGTLLPFDVGSAIRYLKCRPAREHCEEVTLAEGIFSNGAKIKAANDIFIGKSDHSSSLYKIRHREEMEHHSSSGIIVSTPMGATGWQRSILEGSLRILSAVTGTPFRDIQEKEPTGKSENRLRFWVREPWQSLKSQSSLVSGTITAGTPLLVTSEMGEGGTVFADGMQADSFAFPAGESLQITPSATKGRLILGYGEGDMRKDAVEQLGHG